MGETEAAGGRPSEFDFIARSLRPLAGDAALGLADDAAVLAPRPGRSLVLSADTMVEAVHFLPDDPPEDVARKLLRVNLSDLAAMGAAPVGYLLALSVPHARDGAYLARFAAGLAADQREFAIELLGGDTTSTAGPLVATITVVGDVPTGRELRRNGARAGDGLWVTGTIGDAAAGLRVRQGRLADPDGRLAHAYRLPVPRLGFADPVFASAAIDVSDGLLQDARHLAHESGVGVVIERARVPHSAALRAAGSEAVAAALSGGDDYELLLAVPPGAEPGLLDRAARTGTPVVRIGSFGEGAGLRLLDEAGEAISIERFGYNHF